MMQPSLGFSVCREDRRLDPAHVERPHCSGQDLTSPKEPGRRLLMLKYLRTAAIAGALIAIPAAPSFAQVTAQATTTEKTDKKPAKKTAKETATSEKKVSAQQQKMKDCAGKWGDYKKEKNVKGRTEHRKFMSGCLKG
jgi:hypothetical protein